VQKLLLEEQKSLRAIAESFRPDFSRKPSIDCDVKAMIRETCDRVRRYWGIDIEMSVATPLPRVHESLAHEACSIVHEALVNAVKHGKATNANVELSSSSAGNGTLALSIEDDGVGFSFHGRFTLADMIEQKIGPMALRERVIAIGGSLVIESTPDGSKIAVALPIGGDPGCPKQ
jgi:signal transduction histidine kinase